MQTRNLYNEILNGIEALQAEVEGKITLKRTIIEIEDKSEVLVVRQKLGVSQKIFAQLLHINERTLENWEQGRTKPNTQAAVLIKLVNKRPDLIKDLQSI